jgi:hypothetical protein
MIHIAQCDSLFAVVDEDTIIIMELSFAANRVCSIGINPFNQAPVFVTNSTVGPICLFTI